MKHRRQLRLRDSIVAGATLAASLAVAAQQPMQQPAATMQTAPLAPHVATPNAPTPQITSAESSTVLPLREGTSSLAPTALGFLGPYRRPIVPALFPGDATRLNTLIRNGKLYLSLQDAIALALENNLDIEIERYNLTLARTDEVRAAGGGSTRGIDTTIQQTENGVGGPGSPLLTASTASSNPTQPTVTDLTALNATTQQQQSLSMLGTAEQFSAGANVPLFDPQLIGTAGFLRRSDGYTIGNLGSTTTTTQTSSAPLDYVATNLAYMQGFSTGLQLTALANNASWVSYSSQNQLDPFSRPTLSGTLTQPLLRGAGRSVNLRYIRIARTDEKISRLLFEQQVMQTIYGVSRLYYDLVSLGENVAVKQESLRAATKLREDGEQQEKLGTLAPIELTRVRALESASRFDLIQAEGLFQQEEIILRNQLLRIASPAFTAQFDSIVPTDTIVVPAQLDAIDTSALIAQGLAQRPDLAQAELQLATGRISAAASRNAALPQINLYANAQARGASETPYEPLGSAGTSLPSTPQSLELGGLKTSTIYQAGIQVTLPLRNRVAEADAARDQVTLRREEARSEKLSQQIRESIETAIVSLKTAQAAYEAATQSRAYQEQLLSAERDKLTVGQSTELAVLQNEAYLAQAKSSEIAARSDWMKARIELDNAVGDLLEKNHIQLDDAIRGKLPQQ
jgi:outer membrane protein TolC